MAQKSKNNRFVLRIFFIFSSVVVVVLIYFFLRFSQPVLYSWTQIGSDNQLIARAITKSDTCPSIKIDGVESHMVTRSGKQTNVDVTSCEFNIPESASSIEIAGKNLPVLPISVKKIVIIGDTGCKIKGEEVQNCNISKDWPFAQVAKSAALMNPDLIIHVGDFMYRQSPCPANNSRCKDDAWGDTFPSFQADFLKPAKPLLTKAPWIMTRGNHEACNRSGNIWDTFLSVYPKGEKCNSYEEPYTISFDNINMIAIDTSNADDFVSTPEQNAIFTKQFNNLPQVNEPRWLISHRPLYAVMVEKDDDIGKSDPTELLPQNINPLLLKYKSGQMPNQKLVSLNATLQESIPNNLLNTLDLVISGHVHNFEALSFSGNVPSQLAVGNSGTKLQHEITVPLKDIVINDKVVTDSIFLHSFGFFVMEEESTGIWKGTGYDVSGNPVLYCTSKDKNIMCNK